MKGSAIAHGWSKAIYQCYGVAWEVMPMETSQGITKGGERSHCFKRREQRMVREWDNHRDEMIVQARKLREKAAEMLAVPLFQREVKKVVVASHAGEEIPTQVVIKPARWDMRSAAAFLETASDLMRVAVATDSWPKVC